MKLKLKDGKELDIKFWSFTKCQILSQLAVTGIMYGGLILLWLILKIVGVV